MKIENLGKLRLYTVINGRIAYVYNDDNDIQSLDPNSQEIYVEEIPEDQLNVDIRECIPIVHFKNDISNYHSVPFLFKLNKVNTIYIIIRNGI